MKQKCESCEYMGETRIQTVCTTCRHSPHWLCKTCGYESTMTPVQKIAFKESEKSKIISPKDLQEEKEPETLWHKITLVVPQEEGESSPDKWDWHDLIGCIEGVKVESCERAAAPAKEEYAEV